MTNSVSPLDQLLNEIRAASRNAPLLAVAMSVALPDICVSLVSKDGRSDGKRYKEWCEANLKDTFGFVTGDDLWSMRCGVLHNGRYGDMKHNVARVIFTLPGQGFVENNMLNDAYFYSVSAFCNNICDAVAAWVEKHKAGDTFKANVPRLMQYRPNGLAPYIEGLPVVA